uniref:Uncharacterized protein n=1 Tax=Ciona savignyi TaxID=51511 RepID=H2Z1C1_CIOSA
FALYIINLRVISSCGVASPHPRPTKPASLTTHAITTWRAFASSTTRHPGLSTRNNRPTRISTPERLLRYLNRRPALSLHLADAPPHDFFSTMCLLNTYLHSLLYVPYLLTKFSTVTN